MGEWKQVRLGDVCEGKSSNIAQKDLEQNEGKYPIYGASGLIKHVDFYKFDSEYVAIVKDGAGIGRTTLCPAKSSVIGTLQAVLPKPSVDIRYLYYAISNMELAKYYTGATIPHIYFKDYTNELLALPPLPIQQRIADTLDKASVLIEKRKAQIDKFDLLVKSQFVEMFGDPMTNTMGWTKCELGEIADAIDPQPSHRTPPVSDDGIPYVGIAECNYESRKIAFERARKVGRNVLDEHKKRYTISSGDFIIGKIGTIGKPFFVPVDQTYALSANVVLIKPAQKKIIPQFLFSLFESELIEHQMAMEKKATSQPAFGIQKVRKINLIYPPRSLQKDFANLMHQVEQQKALLHQSLEKLEQHYKSLMQKCFYGEILS